MTEYDDSAMYESIAYSEWQEVNQMHSAQFQWHIIASAYKNAADYIVDGLDIAVLPGQHRLYIVCSAMYLYRHYLELQLKTTLLDLREFHKIETTDHSLKSHSLFQVWRSVRKLLSANDALLGEWAHDASREMHDAIEERIKEFDEIDAKSTGYRYPVDLVGSRILAKLPTYQQLNHVKDVIEIMYNYFGGVACWVHEQRNDYWEMQHEIQEMESDWSWC